MLEKIDSSPVINMYVVLIVAAIFVDGVTNKPFEKPGLLKVVGSDVVGRFGEQLQAVRDQARGKDAGVLGDLVPSVAGIIGDVLVVAGKNIIHKLIGNTLSNVDTAVDNVGITLTNVGRPVAPVGRLVSGVANVGAIASGDAVLNINELQAKAADDDFKGDVDGEIGHKTKLNRFGDDRFAESADIDQGGDDAFALNVNSNDASADDSFEGMVDDGEIGHETIKRFGDDRLTESLELNEGDDDNIRVLNAVWGDGDSMYNFNVANVLGKTDNTVGNTTVQQLHDNNDASNAYINE